MSKIDYDKVVVYTAITNKHDDLKKQKYYEEDRKAGIEYRTFLDRVTYREEYNNIKKGLFSWDKIYFTYTNFKDPKRNCQIHKILSHLHPYDFDYSLWIDGSVILKEPVKKIISECIKTGADIVLFKHSERDCIYQEAKDCIHFKLDDIETIKQQMEFYKSVQFPPNFGLSETPVVFRKHSNDVAHFNILWWSIVTKYSKRDQLSFDFCRWLFSQINIDYFEGTVQNNPYFTIKKHKVLREHEKNLDKNYKKI